MDTQEIKDHWTSWAREHGDGIRATTRTMTAKSIEVAALASALRTFTSAETEPMNLFELGCGNGINCISLAEEFPLITFTGVDYVPEMVSHADSAAAKAGVSGRCHFYEGDALALDSHAALGQEYDAVFTVRCLINLQTDDNQIAALASIVQRTKLGGLILLIENSQQSYARQNSLRESLNLDKRSPAAFNHFIDENTLFPAAENLGLIHERTVDIASLHDTVLYALLPSVLDGRIEYDHPLVEAATRLEIDQVPALGSPFGDFGQNRLYVFRRPE